MGATPDTERAEALTEAEMKELEEPLSYSSLAPAVPLPSSSRAPP